MALPVFSRLRVRLLVLVLLAVLPALALLLFVTSKQRRAGTAEARERTLLLARLAASREEALFSGARELLLGLSRVPALRAGELAESERLFSDVLRHDSLYANIALVATDGQLVASGRHAPESVGFSDRPEFRQALEQGEFAIGPYRIDRVTGRPTLNAALPLKDDSGRPRYVLDAALELGPMVDVLRDLPLGRDAVVTILDRKGTVIGRLPDSERWRWRGRSARLTTLGRAAMTLAAQTLEAEGLDREVRTYSIVPVRGPGGPPLILAVGLPRATVFAEADQLYRQGLLWLAVAALFALAAAAFGSAAVLRPVRALLEATHRVSAGEYQVRTGISDRGEIGELAHAFDEMAAAIGERSRERSRAEAALRESEQRFRGAFDNAPIGSALVAPDGRYMRVNSTFCAITGYEADELLARDFQSITHPDDMEPSIEALRRFGSGDLPVYEIEKRYVQKSGKTVWVQLSASPVRDERGAVQYSIVQVRDITDLKHAFQDLADSEARKGAILESSIDAIIAADDQGRIIEFNPAAEAIFGYKRKEILGRDLADTIVPVQLADAHRQGMEHFLATGEGPILGRRIELPARRADGSTFPAEIAITATVLGGRPAFMASLLDITDRKRAEEEIRSLTAQLEERVEVRTRELRAANAQLEEQVRARLKAEDRIRESESGLREYIDHMSTLNAKLTLDGRLLMINRTAELASGLPRDQLMATNFLEGPWWAFDPEVMARVKAAFAHAVEGVPVNYDEEMFAFGRVITINFGLAPVRDESGRVLYVIAEGRDITPQKLLEKTLQQRTIELEGANKELEAFTYSVSHDLRAPLRAIDGFAEILVGEYAEELGSDGRRHLQRIRDNAQQMASLIGDMLSFSRFSRQPLTRRQTDPAALVREVLGDLAHEQVDRRIELKMGDLPPCDADSAMLKQVFVNLLSNALKYTRRRNPAVIEVGCLRPASPSEPIYFVRDNGVGFDMRYADRLFGVFQRLHRAEDYEGTGVGLAIAQRIIYRHGGRIWAESEPDHGATFYFTVGGPIPND